MAALSAFKFRNQLQANYEKTQSKYQEEAKNIEGFDVEDMLAFNKALQDKSVASWASATELKVRHSLAQKIINEIR